MHLLFCDKLHQSKPVGVSFLTNHRLRGPQFTEAEGVWGIRAVRDSGRQDDWGGQRSCWDMGGGRGAAPSRYVHRPAQSSVCGLEAEFSSFVIFSYSPLPTRLFFIMLVYSV